MNFILSGKKNILRTNAASNILVPRGYDPCGHRFVALTTRIVASGNENERVSKIA